MKEFADINAAFDENGSKFSKRVKDTVKTRNCSLQSISLFPTVFLKDLYCRHVRQGLVWERVNLTKFKAFTANKGYSKMLSLLIKVENIVRNTFILKGYSNCYFPLGLCTPSFESVINTSGKSNDHPLIFKWLSSAMFQ